MQENELLLLVLEKVNDLSQEVNSLKTKIIEQQLVFETGMKACRKAFEMCKTVVNHLSESVTDFQELTGLWDKNYQVNF